MEENECAKGRTLSELKQEIKALKERLALVLDDNASLVASVKYYQKSSAGFKGRNKQLAEKMAEYRNKNEELKQKLRQSQEQLLQYKALPWWKKVFQKD